MLIWQRTKRACNSIHSCAIGSCQGLRELSPVNQGVDVFDPLILVERGATESRRLE